MLDPITKNFHVQRLRDSAAALAGADQSDFARDHLRAVIARSVAGGGEDSVHYAAKRWGASSRATQIVKAGVSAVDADDLNTANAAARAFFRTVIEQTLLGRMPAARRVGFNVRNLRPGTNSTGYWVGEGRPCPLSRFNLEGEALPARKVAALVVISKETLQDPAGEAETLADIQRAVVLAVDAAFIDAGNAGTAEVPAAITNGAASTASAADPGTDLAQLIADFEGDLDQAVFVTDPVTATQAALARDAGGGFLFPTLGPRGGSVINMPVLTSRASPRDSNGGQWALVDQAGCAVAMESLGIARSTAATILMSDTPDSEPTAVSLFQNDLVGLMATLRANWSRVRPGSVAVITGAEYQAGT